MQNEFEPVANRNQGGFVQYVCQLCGGYRTLVGASDKFLLFIDHLIGDLAVLEYPKLKNPVWWGIRFGINFLNPTK
jgi:hypothetical protein